jgi:glycine/D-amino acid oxidase-like deaminating enzyme
LQQQIHNQPARTDILVIGGGIAGTALAYFLAREGAEVTLIEEHDLGTLASGSNAGSLHAQIPHHEFKTEGDAWAKGFAPVIPLMLESIALWQELEKELACDFELSLPGGLLVAETAAQLGEIRRKAELEARHGLPVEILGPQELNSMAPYISRRMAGAAYCPKEGKINPLIATPALARAAEGAGVRILRRTRLEALKTDGPIFSSLTSQGEITAGRVVNCAGANAGRIARMLGFDLDIQGYPIQVNVTEPTAPLVKHLVYFAGEKLTLKQTRLGSFLIGGGWPALWDSLHQRLAVNPASLFANLKTAVTVVPELAQVNMIRTWPAMVNGTADWRPVLGPLPKLPGFFMCVFPWMGLTAGPLSARLVADTVLGNRPPERFAQFFA